MNAERLLKHYEQIAEASDAVARLRRFILDLAVRGKLVPQDPTDEPASELLKRIAKEKARLDRKERTKREPNNLNGGAESIQMPNGWALAPLADLVAVLNGRAYKQNELLSAGTPVLRVGNLFTSNKWYYSTLQLDEDKYCEKGDLIFAWSASFGPFIWDGEKVIYHYHIWKLTLHSESDLSKRYLYNFLLQKTREIKEAGHGISMIHMTKEKMEKLAVPLPPLAEQHRIVAKVDQLMALCDQLELARGSREAVRNRLAAASLARLNASDPETFRADTRFALEALPALTARPDQIKAIRETILNLAVRGDLNTSRPDDLPALADLKLIAGRKKEAALRKAKHVAPVDEAERWCRIPEGWEWVRWDQITDWITYGFTRPMPHEADGVPIVTGKNVNLGRIIFDTADRTPQDAFDALNEKDKPQKGDILITKDGSIGRTAVVETDEIFCINQSVAVLWLRSCHLNRRFLQMVLDCPRTQLALLEKTAGVAIKHISIIDLGKMVFPLPPVAEQHRIVAKVDALMSLCDQLEASLTAATVTRRRLLDALLAEALEPAEARELEAAE